jgi:hypothetical protein
MTEMPYLRAVANLDVIVDVTGWMDCVHNYVF